MAEFLGAATTTLNLPIVLQKATKAGDFKLRVIVMDFRNVGKLIMNLKFVIQQTNVQKMTFGPSPRAFIAFSYLLPDFRCDTPAFHGGHLSTGRKQRK